MPSPWNQARLARARQRYLDLRIDQDTATLIQDKYRRLEVILASDELVQAKTWKALVADYPGVLRETEMCSPTTLQDRIAVARKFAAWIGKTRLRVLDQAQIAPVLLWKDLHHLLGDLQQWRRHSGSKKAQLQDFSSWAYEHCNQAGRVAWPSSRTPLVSNEQGRPSQQTAYAWLALLLGTNEKTLLETLVDRVGARRLLARGSCPSDE